MVKSSRSCLAVKRWCYFFVALRSLDLTKPGAKLRKELLEALESEDFEVVLGEDDGLEKLRSMYGHYAHENELQFIQGQCNPQAQVLI